MPPPANEHPNETAGEKANSSQPTLEKMLAEQRDILLKIYENTNKTKKYILFGRIVSAIYLCLVLGAIILGAALLPPLLKNVVEPYQELLGTTNELNMNSGAVDSEDLGRLLNTFSN